MAPRSGNARIDPVQIAHVEKSDLVSIGFYLHRLKNETSHPDLRLDIPTARVSHSKDILWDFKYM